MSEYIKLGQVLRSYRLAADESVEDLSGAVEVDPKFITDLEKGAIQPPEDILALIINHLELEDTEADELWLFAGYTIDSQNEGAEMTILDDDKARNISVPEDLPILYTDMVNVVSNKYGVVFNFVQGVGPNGSPIVVSRVGMSHEHAQSVLDVLQKSLDRPQDKQ